jgi:hypothetical protein
MRIEREVMVNGRCNCGTVKFEIDLDIKDVFICHCTMCRRSTGSNGIAVVVVDNDTFRWTKGESNVTTWKESDGNWETSFCQTCGSPLPGINDKSRMYVPAGLIEKGGDSLRVVHHIFVDFKAPWDIIGDSGKQHKRSFKND